VLLFSAVKDAHDDFVRACSFRHTYAYMFVQQRHRSDSQVNNRTTKTVRDGNLVEEKWQNIRVGDVIRLESDEFVAVSKLLTFLLSVGKTQLCRPIYNCCLHLSRVDCALSKRPNWTVKQI
jgi:hypothetical protein